MTSIDAAALRAQVEELRDGRRAHLVAAGWFAGKVLEAIDKATTAAAEENAALVKKLNEMRMSQPPPRGWGSSYDRGYDKGWNDALDDIADVLTARSKKEEHKK